MNVEKIQAYLREAIEFDPASQSSFVSPIQRAFNADPKKQTGFVPWCLHRALDLITSGEAGQPSNIKSRSEYALEACRKIEKQLLRMPVVYVCRGTDIAELVRKGANPCDHVHTAKKKIQVDANTVAWTENFFCVDCGDKVVIR